MGQNINYSISKLKQLLCFEESVRYGSISKAAEHNNMKQSNLSAQIKMLEESLKQKLLIRLSNGVQLTDNGYEYYTLVCNIKNLLHKIENLPHDSPQITGAIHLWMTDGLGLGVLSKCFDSFYQKYPSINIEVTCSLEMPKLDEFDMAIVFQKPNVKALSVKAEYNLKFGMFASKEYLSKFGTPKDINDLKKNHKIINRTSYNTYFKKWNKIVEDAQGMTTSTNSSAILLNLIQGGTGVGLLPLSTGLQDEHLVELKHLKLYFQAKFWLVVRKDKENTEKIKALIDVVNQESAKL